MLFSLNLQSVIVTVHNKAHCHNQMVCGIFALYMSGTDIDKASVLPLIFFAFHVSVPFLLPTIVYVHAFSTSQNRSVL